jgi:hypothetical protein
VLAAICTVSQTVARRFILGKQDLWPGRRWRGRVGTEHAMRAVEHLQLDPLVVLESWPLWMSDAAIACQHRFA